MKWINTSKKLPKKGKIVLLSTNYPNKEYNRVTVGYYSEGNEEWNSTCWRDMLKNSFQFDDSFSPAFISVDNVSHWMPLPEPKI